MSDGEGDVSAEKKSRSSGSREHHSKSYTNSSRRDRDYEKDSSRGYRSSDQNYRSDDRGSRSSGKYSESMQINRDHIGMVIGRGGSNIKDIQSKFSVNVNVDKNSNDNGTNSVSVSGDSQSNVDDAMNHIRDQVENAPERSNDRRRDDRRSGGYGGYNNDRYSRDDRRDRGGYGNDRYSRDDKRDRYSRDD